LVSFVVWKRFFAPLKDMTVRAAERLQIFLSCNYVIPSEVEESLDVNPIMGRDYNFWNYKNHSVLYIGVTNSLSRRTWQHREGDRPGFAADYRCTKLIYYEWYRDIRDAICTRESIEEVVACQEGDTH